MSIAQATDAIQAVNRKFEAAVADSDAAAMAAIYTIDGQALPPNGEIVSGRIALQQFWQGVLSAGLKRVTLETLELDTCGDTIIEIGKATLFADVDQILDVAKFIVVWKQEDGAWKWHRDIWNSTPRI